MIMHIVYCKAFVRLSRSNADASLQVGHSRAGPSRSQKLQQSSLRQRSRAMQMLVQPEARRQLIHCWAL